MTARKKSAAKPAVVEQGWQCWSAKPTKPVIEAHVRAFFDAIRARDAAKAFSLCPHYKFSAPYVEAPDKKSIAKAFKLIGTVLADNEIATGDDVYGRIGVHTTNCQPEDVFATVAIDGKPTGATALFKLVQTDQGWQLTFYMLRIR